MSNTFNQQGQNVTNQYNAETIVLNDELATVAFKAMKAQIEALTISDQEKQSTIKSQQETIAALVQQKGRRDNTFDVDEALRDIAQNDLSKADAILASVIDEDELAIAETAKRYIQRGALWFATDTDKAISFYHRAVQLAPSNAESWNQLGRLYRRHGRLEDAENAYNTVKQIGIDENDQGLQAIAYGNIGIIYDIQGKLDDALSMYQKALEIDEALGRQEGMASIYGNIGIIYKRQGKLDEALSMYQKSLEIEKSLGRQEGMASDYGNIGNVYQTQGKLDEALSMYQKSLEIDEALGRQEGMANQYGNIGNVYQKQGKLADAKRVWLKSEALFKSVGINHKAETVRGCLEGLE